jgi:hypothetical protein
VSRCVALFLVLSVVVNFGQFFHATTIDCVAKREHFLSQTLSRSTLTPASADNGRSQPPLFFGFTWKPDFQRLEVAGLGPTTVAVTRCDGTKGTLIIA